MVQGIYKGAQGFFKEGFKEVSRAFCQNIIGISRVFQRCFKENSCFFSGCFQVVLCLTICFKEVQGALLKFNGSFKEISRVFQDCFKNHSRKFQEPSKQVLRRFQMGVKDISRLFLGSFKAVSRMFQRYFKEV